MIAGLVAETGPVSWPEHHGTNFEVLVQGITYQQLAGAAARAIHGRLLSALDNEVTPERMVALSEDELRAVGMSHNKALSLLDLSAKVLDGTVVLDAKQLASLSDQEVIDRLVQVRGIGEWTAQVFLLLTLHRPDVLPVGDLAIRRGFGLAWGIPIPTAKELKKLGERFKPYRSTLAWYCWRADELYAGTKSSAVTGGSHADDIEHDPTTAVATATAAGSKSA